jgi:hypothetical protein
MLKRAEGCVETASDWLEGPALYHLGVRTRLAHWNATREAVGVDVGAQTRDV